MKNFRILTLATMYSLALPLVAYGLPLVGFAGWSESSPPEWYRDQVDRLAQAFTSGLGPEGVKSLDADCRGHRVGIKAYSEGLLLTSYCDFQQAEWKLTFMPTWITVPVDRTTLPKEWLEDERFQFTTIQKGDFWYLVDRKEREIKNEGERGYQVPLDEDRMKRAFDQALQTLEQEANKRAIEANWRAIEANERAIIEIMERATKTLESLKEFRGTLKSLEEI